MQQRIQTTPTDQDSTSTQSEPSPKGRQHNSAKLKVLVRSHAVREDTSPPRSNPFIKVIPSTETSPSVVLSPATSPCLSPVSVTPPRENGDLNRQNLDKSGGNNNNDCGSGRRRLICDCANQTCAKCKSQERNFNNNLTNVMNNVGGGNTLTVSRGTQKGKLRQQSSSQGSFEGSSSNSPCLSRDSSSEQYTDTSGADLEVFIPETINRNAKDRAFMLRIEQELISLAKDKTKTHYKFPPMSSYQRMLVHRCAAYFGMDHNIESSGKCVVVNKTKSTRIPEIEFKEHIRDDIVFGEEQTPPRRSILKRDSNSVEDYAFKSPERQYSLENSRRSKSFEEREEEYAKVRKRIFNKEELCLLRQMHDGSGSREEFEWEEVPWSSTDSDSSRIRIIGEGGRKYKLTKVVSEDAGETTRPYVAKSYSFGGYGGVLNRGDSVVSTHSAGPRLLTKQDSAASSVSWRLSPSSSGYKSQSQMSESITPSPTSTPNQLQEHTSSTITTTSSDSRIVWAVTDIQRVPKGSLIIDPQTGQPVKNEDGSLYHYDPTNPPLGLSGVGVAKPPPSPKKGVVSPKKVKAIKTSPIHMNHRSHFTNTATSPSLPYASPPPLQPIRNGGFQDFSYGGGYEAVPFYQQPCVVYTTQGYNTGHFERIETQPINELQTYYASVPENPPYQQAPPYWNQQPITFYQNTPPAPNPTPPQRQFVPPPLPPPQAPPSYVSTFPNFLPPPPQGPPPDILSVFPPQQIIYPQPPPCPLYTTFPGQQPQVYGAYPPAASTPTTCPPTFSSHDMIQLTQGVSQLSFVGQSQPQLPYPKMALPQKGKPPKPVLMGSSASSTGTNSPAATVVAAGYCPQPMGGASYRTPPETPPHHQFFGQVPPLLLRQMSNVRANTPGTTRSSRSPTPASDISIFTDRTRIPPPNVYHGMPYVFPTDNRMIPTRGHPPPYRHPPPTKQQTFPLQQADNKAHKFRKSRGGAKPSTLSNQK